jgi:serine/threonine-protein kinase
MCSKNSSEIAQAIKSVVCSSPEPITTEAIARSLANRGVCVAHAKVGLHEARRTRAVRPVNAPKDQNPINLPEALWTSQPEDALGEVEILVQHRFGIPLPKKVLGRGGNGIVVQGLQLSIDRPCAIKLLDPELLRHPQGEAGQTKRFDREVRYLARLSHPNIITVYDGGRATSTGAPYLAMELMEWPTLDQLITEQGALPPVLVAKLIRAAATGLQYAYDRAKVFHRDIKPANLFVSLELGTAKVADFGLACLDDTNLEMPARDTRLTRKGQGLVGSPVTAAPERYHAAKGDYRSDIYSLGMTAYLALTGGHPPFPGIIPGESSVLEWLNAHDNVDTNALNIRHSTRRPDCPERLAQLLHRMIRREPQDRPQSYPELLRDLDRVIRDLEAETPHAPEIPKAPPTPRQVVTPAAAEAPSEVTDLAAALQGQRFEAPFETPTILDPDVALPEPLVFREPEEFAPLLERMSSLEKRVETEFGPDALYLTDQALLKSLAARALEKGLVPVLREIHEAETGGKFPEFERNYGRQAAGEKLPPGSLEVPLPLTRYFYNACGLALLTTFERRILRAKELAGRVLTFLEEAISAPETQALRKSGPLAETVPSEGPPGDSSAGSAPGTQVLPPSAADPFAAGTKIGPITIIRVIGQGGMATVYLANDTDLDRQVAVKVLKPSSDPAVEEENKRRFSRELKLAASLKHPNIIPIHSTFVHEGRQGLVMDLVDGTSLATIIRSTNRLEPHRALKVVRQVASGLSYAHKREIIHRDIKPDNILVDVTDRAVIIDFGITKSFRVEPGAQSGLTTVQGSFLGTPHYTSPEQSSGFPVDQRTDIYSLGATLYEMLSGVRPYTAPTELALLHKIADLKTLPEPLSRRVPGIDPEIEALVDRMMAKRSEERFLSCDDVLVAIDRLLPRLEGRLASSGRRRMTAAAIALAITVVGIGTYAAWPRRSASPNLVAGSPKGPFLLSHDVEKRSEPPPKGTSTPNPVIGGGNEVKGTAKVPTPEAPRPPAPVKPLPPPYQPTEADLRSLAQVLEVMKKSFESRCGYSFAAALADLESLARSPETTPWTAVYIRAEGERLKEAARLVAARPLFPTDKEVQLVLRDGKTLRGRVTSEDAARITFLLPSGLSEDVPLTNIAPVTLAASLDDPWDAFVLRASAGDAAGALAMYATAAEALALRIEQGHLPGLVDEAIEEAFSAGGRGNLVPLRSFALPPSLRAKIPPVLGDRLARLDVEVAAAALYDKRAEMDARSRLLTDRRSTFAGLRLAGEIMTEFRRDAEKNGDRELVTIPRWATWMRDSERAPKATFLCDQDTKTYVVTAVDAKDRALIKKKFAGSRQGYEVRLRLEQAYAVAVVGISLTRWVELSTNEVRFFSEGALSGSVTIPQESYRFAVTILPDAVAGQNLVYVNGNLTFALDSHVHALGGGIILGAGGGAVRVESLTVRNSQVHDDDE